MVLNKDAQWVLLLTRQYVLVAVLLDVFFDSSYLCSQTVLLFQRAVLMLNALCLNTHTQ